LRSACSTARTVPALLGVVCALRRPGADMAAALATLPLTNIRRDVGMESPPRDSWPARAHCTLFSWLHRFRHGLSYAASTKQDMRGLRGRKSPDTQTVFAPRPLRCVAGRMTWEDTGAGHGSQRVVLQGAPYRHRPRPD